MNPHKSTIAPNPHSQNYELFTTSNVPLLDCISFLSLAVLKGDDMVHVDVLCSKGTEHMLNPII